MEHEHSILYEPFNKYIWRHAFGFDVPDHVVMALLVLVISCIVFPLMSRRISRDNPGGFQQFLEMIVGGLKDLLRRHRRPRRVGEVPLHHRRLRLLHLRLEHLRPVLLPAAADGQSEHDVRASA